MGGVRVSAGLAAALVLAGCDRLGSPRPAPAAAGQVVRAVPGEALRAQAQTGPGLHLAYTHEIGLELPAGAVPAHFAAARDRCLSDAALHCLLIYAAIGGQAHSGLDTAPPADSASLRVRLPHDQVGGFVAALTVPRPGETPGAVRVVTQASTADDLGQPVADASQQVAQLTAYLASLKVLGARLTLSVSDQVKVAEETARAQTQLEEAQGRQRELALRVDTEEVDVTFTGLQAAAPATDPVTQVLAGAQDSLRRNAAEAMAFGIAALPWVPVGFVALVVLWVIRRLVFGARGARRGV